jgi:Fe-Mn family superoxide dismutase
MNPSILRLMKTSTDLSRRNFIRTGSMLALGGLIAPAFGIKESGTFTPDTGEETDGPRFEMPPLPYTYSALEPAIDRQTMELHYGKHHMAYVDKLNEAMKDVKKAPANLESLLQKISKYPKAVRNNAGGHYNHSMFWKLMKPDGGGQPRGELAMAIEVSFGTFDAFKAKFSEEAVKHFGSGWTWLVRKKNGLAIGTTDNQDNPLMDISDFKGTPVLALDVWEHAYYLKYNNRRTEYIQAWWNLVNWEEASRNYANAKY